MIVLVVKGVFWANASSWDGQDSLSISYISSSPRSWDVWWRVKDLRRYTACLYWVVPRHLAMGQKENPWITSACWVYCFLLPITNQGFLGNLFWPIAHCHLITFLLFSFSPPSTSLGKWLIIYLTWLILYLKGVQSINSISGSFLPVHPERPEPRPVIVSCARLQPSDDKGIVANHDATWADEGMKDPAGEKQRRAEKISMFLVFFKKK